jgi:hypothetical protein
VKHNHYKNYTTHQVTLITALPLNKQTLFIFNYEPTEQNRQANCPFLPDQLGLKYGIPASSLIHSFEFKTLIYRIIIIIRLWIFSVPNFTKFWHSLGLINRGLQDV